MGFDEIISSWASASFCEYGLFWALKEIFPKMHDNVDVVWVANEMKPCGLKNLSLTISFHDLGIKDNLCCK